MDQRMGQMLLRSQPSTTKSKKPQLSSKNSTKLELSHLVEKIVKERNFCDLALIFIIQREKLTKQWKF